MTSPQFAQYDHDPAIGMVRKIGRTELRPLLLVFLRNAGWELLILDLPLFTLLARKVSAVDFDHAGQLLGRRRKQQYDALIAVLFPKLAGKLGSSRGQTVPKVGSNYGNPSGLSRVSTNSGFLTGPAYEEWKRRYPEAAANWEKSRNSPK